MLIDTHCHLDFDDFNDDRPDVLKRARDAGVACIINVGSSMEGSARSVRMSEENDFIYASVGIHPHEADKVKADDIKTLAEFLKNPKVKAIGEIGLDYYRNISSKENQKKLFISFLELARSTGLPLIIHCREAHSDMAAILKNIMGGAVKGVMHCFSGDEAFLKTCLDMRLFISFTCNITYKNAVGLREIVKITPMDRLLIETDAPFLAPQDFRGKRNEPAYVRYAAKEAADVKGMDIGEVEKITTDNAIRLFGLPKC
ncbi:MAG: TatD family hydrolase, partial [Candidatus Omnitrophota bacterium]|jgi:TatD DNase family protein